ncbi:hypothetical protein FRX31_004680 [Thalictrum thalictroides]|uniref:Retrotransposon gag domain-containing protein n=1 Tax=Thalictrum thalictroides TaxID=46969 RepID=A0A7J6XBJ0_THATH|nr:hypothetical protein FRX31_004680 [Thalictrum thalictroides]
MESSLGRQSQGRFHRGRQTRTEPMRRKDDLAFSLTEAKLKDMISTALRKKDSRDHHLNNITTLTGSNSPFSIRIQAAQHSTDFKTPALSEYDEFEGEARRWFLSLPSKSIDNFTQLQDAFLEHYRHNWKKPQDVAGLFILKKRADETLSDFVYRFRRMAAEIPEKLYPLIRMEFATLWVEEDSISRALRDGRHKDHVDKKGKQKVDFNKNKSEGSKSVRDGKQPEMVLTPLNTTYNAIFEFIKDKNLLSAPFPLREDSKDTRDKTLWCTFHDDYGHITENCCSLRARIQRLVERGKANISNYYS